jgi:hypothetical protein
LAIMSVTGHFLIVDKVCLNNTVCHYLSFLGAQGAVMSMQRTDNGVINLNEDVHGFV